MESNFQSQIFAVEGMTCAGCKVRIEQRLRGMAGISRVNASFIKGTIQVDYDSSLWRREQLRDMLTEKLLPLGYRLANRSLSSTHRSSNNMASLVVAGILGYFLIRNTVGFDFIPPIDETMGYGILFFIGMITSVHCLAMCGGINLSQNIKIKDSDHGRNGQLMPGLLYNSGRVISYTALGGLAGTLGSVIGFTGEAKGLVAIIAGCMMVIIGLHMLNLSGFLRKFIIRMPRRIGEMIFKRASGSNVTRRGTFLVGILNGFMPCGPLQAMQLYALGTGSFVEGAAAMLMFGLGTVPLMFLFGALSSFLSAGFTRKMMRAGGVLVVVLGVVMLNRGMAISGISPVPIISGTRNIASIEGGVQQVKTAFERDRYQSITVRKGIPVRWNMEVADPQLLNSCNRTVVIPAYKIERQLIPGNNLIEFTPNKTGDFPYSCWMGMIQSTITVID